MRPTRRIWRSLEKDTDSLPSGSGVADSGSSVAKSSSIAALLASLSRVHEVLESAFMMDRHALRSMTAVVGYAP
jgi:hypothetical protein